MAQRFDATLKHILEAHPADFLRLAGLPTEAPVEVIDADLAAVSAEADKVFRVREKPSWLMHFEMQTGYDARLPERMLQYNVLLKVRHRLPVRSVVLLLRPKADGPEMAGVVRHAVRGQQYLEFHYGVVRLWQRPVESILVGGVGTLPLAPLAQVPAAELPGVIGRMKERFGTEVQASEAAQLWTATYVLMGLRYDQVLAHELLKGVGAMEDSVTYQEIIRKGKAEGKAEGAAEEARRILLLVGSDALGKPDARTKTAIAGLTDREHLEALIQRVGKVDNWDELLAEPRPRRRNGTRRKAD